MLKRKKVLMALAAIFTGVFYGQAHAQIPLFCEQPDASNNCKPCAIAAAVLNNSLLNALDDDLKGFVQLLAGDVADIDGAFLIDDSQESLIASLTGDDIRDIGNQMQIIDRIIRNPALFPDTAVLPASELRAAYTANFNVITDEKIGSDISGVLAIVIKEIFPLLTYFTLLGRQDDFVNITSDDPIVTDGRGTLGVLQALLVLLDGTEISGTTTLDFIDTTVSNDEFITFGEILGPDGDLDGDGFSNICEYRHFRRTLCSSQFPNIAPSENSQIDFVTAVLDPTITPVGCFETEVADDDCRIEMSPLNVVPPNNSGAYGEVRYRRFFNPQLNKTRYQINYLHTIESTAPSAKIVKGLPGVAGTDVLVNIPVATPEFWELYLTEQQAQALRSTSNYLEVTGKNADDEVQTIRGDNTCSVLAPPPPSPHDADTNGDFVISVDEVLEVISFINANGYSCAEGGGYIAGGGDQNCDAHDSDYNPEDFRINLPELLRLVQLYTAGEYEECIGGSEDGFCITVE
ncbi:MAG: hypothetical protein RLZZ303_1830 [Candidatus Hydrogenedentota bacterium]|jgi:hypothetical protein